MPRRVTYCVTTALLVTYRLYHGYHCYHIGYAYYSLPGYTCHRCHWLHLPRAPSRGVGVDQEVGRRSERLPHRGLAARHTAPGRASQGK